MRLLDPILLLFAARYLRIAERKQQDTLYLDLYNFGDGFGCNFLDFLPFLVILVYFFLKSTAVIDPFTHLPVTILFCNGGSAHENSIPACFLWLTFLAESGSGRFGVYLLGWGTSGEVNEGVDEICVSAFGDIFECSHE
jgi:hypothetical protein